MTLASGIAPTAGVAPPTLVEKLLTANRLALGAALTLFASFVLIGTMLVSLLALQTDSRIFARVIADNAAASIAFHDPVTARAVLQTLQHSPQVVSATIVDDTGDVFADYVNGVSPPTLGMAAEVGQATRYSARHLHVAQAIEVGDEVVGTLHLAADLMPLYRKLLIYLAVTLVAALAALMLVNRLLRRANGEVLHPLGELTALTDRIARQDDYQVRAETCNIAELDSLATGFNRMLEQIEERDTRLAAHREQLEDEVAERTCDLLHAKEAAEAANQEILEAKATLEHRVQERTRELQDQVSAKEQALSELAAAQGALIEVSRSAGMAEVATGVLHNVGNVLNSVNVSCNLIMEQLRESRAGNVGKVANLLANPGSDLASFLREDPRGSQIPNYLTSLGVALEQERSLVQAETRALHDRIEHIKEIVAMQQTYGRVMGLLETLPPEQLMEDALKLNTEALARHDVTVHREYASVPKINVDKHKVLQILLNLINNAKYACTHAQRDEKIVTLRISNCVPGWVRMEVIDNGVGISQENLTRIFRHGFTTRNDGHGFGLHSGALAAKSLGGSLTAASDGPDTGAVFTLELPLNSGEAA